MSQLICATRNVTSVVVGIGQRLPGRICDLAYLQRCRVVRGTRDVAKCVLILDWQATIIEENLTGIAKCIGGGHFPRLIVTERDKLSVAIGR